MNKQLVYTSLLTVKVCLIQVGQNTEKEAYQCQSFLKNTFKLLTQIFEDLHSQTILSPPSLSSSPCPTKSKVLTGMFLTSCHDRNCVLFSFLRSLRNFSVLYNLLSNFSYSLLSKSETSTTYSQKYPHYLFFSRLLATFHRT